MNKLFEQPKMRIIVISAAAALLLTAIIITIACLNVGKKPDQNLDDSDNDSLGAFAEITDIPSDS